MEKYAAYQKKLLIHIREYDLEYELKTPPFPANPKNVILALSGLMLIATITLAGKSRLFLMISIIFFLLFLGGYVYLDYIEGEKIIESVGILEKDLKEMENTMEV